jgi:hypothetical protein
MAESANADDIFLLYNEKEEDINPIAETLKSAGLSVYFYRRDLPVGSDIQAVESEKLRSARAVVVLLGKHGWGPTQREIAFQAESLQKVIVPVLIDEPPADALADVDGMFQRRRRIDFRERAVMGHVELALEIQNLLDPAGEAKSPRYDDIFKTLFDGSEADRLELLNWIIANGFRDAQTLANKLVDAIVGDFSPTRQNPFEASIRDPNRLPAARSWMLSVLLWLRVEDDNHTKVILDHVDYANENDRAVRFWTLAGIIQTDRSCRAAAIEQALDDPSPEVAGLARVATDPSGDAVLNDLRVALASDRFETVWWVLRVLRIFPVPSLAADVVNQLGRTADGRSLAYDALFALSSASMRSAARPHILEHMGLTALARIVVVESRNSTPISLDAFARVLSAFERGEATQALETAAEDAEDRRLVGRLIDRIEAHQAVVTETDPRLPGHAPDIIDIGKDDIGIRRDVQTLTSVMLSREVEPPLAIGLFGEWGSGKSFYIKSLEAEVKAISNRPAGGPYCTRVVQINFNAWHYVDTNLWASLVSHILESLAVYLKPSKSPEEQRAALASDLASAKEGVAIATEEQKLAAKLLKTSTAELQQKVFEREHSEVRLRDLRAQDLSDILKDDKALAETLHGAFDMVGAPALVESASELERAIRDVYSTTGKAKAFFVSIFTGRNALIVLLGMLVVLGLPPLAFALRAHIGDYLANASAVLGTITAIFGSAAMVLKTAVTKFKTGLEALSSAKSKIDARLADKRAVVSDEEKRLQDQVADAFAQEAAASGRVEAAATRVREIEERLTALKDSQSLGYFITERTKSDDYRRHLGLIATIRKDFDGLVERIQNEADGVDRIVLYIDDVDRCPPEMVVEILQAVHLLLAYKLFVVIVSVDPRWLLKSLGSSIPQMQSENDAQADPVATPQDYLEKIFQIPFTVRPMGKPGFGRLMDRLLTPATVDIELTELSAEDVAPRAGGASRDETPANDSDVTQQPSQEGNIDPSPDIAAAPSEPKPVELAVPAQALFITSIETEFARGLYMLLATPRSAKRFANIYRLLKASLSAEALPAFEGRSAVPGTFQLPMLLLALLVGKPQLAAKLFPKFLAGAQSHDDDWWEAGWKGLERPEQEIRSLLAPIVEVGYFPGSPQHAVQWLPQVSRYSFMTASIFIKETA